MKRISCIMIILFPLLISAQTNENIQGIQWTTGLSWEQVKQKAKNENKYIFLDCFTTWCPPCKKMDQITYSDKSVADYFNDKFISVKVQIDRSKNDDASVRNWYLDAEIIAKQYHIDTYPSFIFLSPEGTITEKGMGFKEPPAFIILAKSAMQPGKIYHDPFEAYNQLVSDYNNGIKHYDKMLGMVKVAQGLGEKKFANSLLAEHARYVAKQPKKHRYSEEEIIFWSRQELKSSDQLFQLFYEDGKLIDKVTKTKGFAAGVVHNTILKEIIIPFFKEQAGGTVMLQQGMGLMMMDALGQPIRSPKVPEPDTIEANWKQLETIIRKKFNQKLAQQEVEEARQLWYEKHNNWVAYGNTYLKKLKKQGLDSWINNNAWNIFLYVTDLNLLQEIIPWVEKAIAKYPDSPIMDTYANLLYKVGRNKDAITWEGKAAELAGNNNAFYLKTMEKMRKGEPTWN